MRAGWVALALLVGTFASPAEASQLIDRNASAVKLTVSRGGVALLRYTAGGKGRTVVAWGAINARPPSRSRPQVSFRIDYSGGWGARRLGVAQGFTDTCRRYDGPPLAWLVTACKAGDGSYWAVQRWQRMLPNLGYDPWKKDQRVWELRLSHWRGAVAKIDVWNDWIYNGRFQGIFGRLTYLDRPVYGFKTSGAGVPLDSYGRNLYLDTFGSAYGPGWKRENSFLAHTGTGVFCYGFFPRPPYSGYPPTPGGMRPAGHGQRYRITVIGPGVTPDVIWEGQGLGDFDPKDTQDVEYERQANRVREEVARNDRLCRQR